MEGAPTAVEVRGACASVRGHGELLLHELLAVVLCAATNCLYRSAGFCRIFLFIFVDGLGETTSNRNMQVPVRQKQKPKLVHIFSTHVFSVFFRSTILVSTGV